MGNKTNEQVFCRRYTKKEKWRLALSTCLYIYIYGERNKETKRNKERKKEKWRLALSTCLYGVQYAESTYLFVFVFCMLFLVSGICLEVLYRVLYRVLYAFYCLGLVQSRRQNSIEIPMQIKKTKTERRSQAKKKTKKKSQDNEPRTTSNGGGEREEYEYDDEGWGLKTGEREGGRERGIRWGLMVLGLKKLLGWGGWVRVRALRVRIRVSEVEG